MPTKLKELRQLVRFCKQNGVFRCKTAGFEIEISKAVLKKPKRSLSVAPEEETSQKETPQFPAWESMSAEQQLLFSSTPVPIEEN